MKKVSKPWGYEMIFAETDKYIGKIIHIKMGEKLSRQYHNQKDETFLIQEGEMLLELGDKEFLTEKRMKPGDTYHCKPGTIHRMIGITDVSLIEVSTPEISDVVRLEDKYGREGTTKP